MVTFITPLSISITITPPFLVYKNRKIDYPTNYCKIKRFAKNKCCHNKENPTVMRINISFNCCWTVGPRELPINVFTKNTKIIIATMKIMAVNRNKK